MRRPGRRHDDVSWCSIEVGAGMAVQARTMAGWNIDQDEGEAC